MPDKRFHVHPQGLKLPCPIGCEHFQTDPNLNRSGVCLKNVLWFKRWIEDREVISF